MIKLVELHPRLFVRGHTRHCDTNKLLDLFRERGISLVVNVALINDEILASGCRTIGVRYRYEPLSDSRYKPLPTDKILELIDLVERTMDGSTVLVHCDSGFNRSQIVAIPALVRYTGEDPAAIIARLRIDRPDTLHNPRFEQFVLEKSYVRSNGETITRG